MRANSLFIAWLPEVHFRWKETFRVFWPGVGWARRRGLKAVLVFKILHISKCEYDKYVSIWFRCDTPVNVLIEYVCVYMYCDIMAGSRNSAARSGGHF
jgi:hypothetical protein